MADPLHPIPDDERRGFQRVATQRDVIFSQYDATGPLRDGTVVDMSAGGLRILTRSPETPGTDIQMELQPTDVEPDASVVLLEGRIMHVSPTEDGQYTMGVKRLQRGMASSGATPRPYLRGSERPEPVAEAQRESKHDRTTESIVTPEESTSAEAEPAEKAEPVYRYPTPQPARRRKLLGIDLGTLFIGLFVIVFTVTAIIVITALV